MEGSTNSPLYESRVIQVYPTAAKEQKSIRLYEAGCWELVSSDRVQERNGNTTRTFIRMTFRRNKNMPHYQEIAAASRDLEYLQDKQGGVTSEEDKYAKKFLLFFVLGLVVFPAIFIFWPMAYISYKKARRAQAGESGEFSKEEAAAFAKMEAVRKRYGV